MIPVSTSVLMVLLKPLRVLSAVQLVDNFGRRRRISAKQRGAKSVSLCLGNVWRKKPG